MMISFLSYISLVTATPINTPHYDVTCLRVIKGLTLQQRNPKLSSKALRAIENADESRIIDLRVAVNNSPYLKDTVLEDSPGSQFGVQHPGLYKSTLMKYIGFSEGAWHRALTIEEEDREHDYNVALWKISGVTDVIKAMMNDPLIFRANLSNEMPNDFRAYELRGHRLDERFDGELWTTLNNPGSFERPVEVRMIIRDQNRPPRIFEELVKYSGAKIERLQSANDIPSINGFGVYRVRGNPEQILKLSNSPYVGDISPIGRPIFARGVRARIQAAGDSQILVAITSQAENWSQIPPGEGRQLKMAQATMNLYRSLQGVEGFEVDYGFSGDSNSSIVVLKGPANQIMPALDHPEIENFGVLDGLDLNIRLHARDEDLRRLFPQQLIGTQAAKRLF